MIIINKKWAVGADSMNITLYHKSKPRKTDTKPGWAFDSYYSSLHNVLQALVNRGVRDTDLSLLKSAIKLSSLIKSLPNITVPDLKG